MCGCVAHYDKDTPCTCRCPEHATKLKLVDPATTVTLRPDNPDDVKRLADALDSLSTAGAWTASDAVAAMRSLLPPSAPPEPNGLGAVVECRYEHIAGHGIFDGQDWCFRHGHGADHALSPGSLDIVTVVQHGVGCSCGGPGCPGGEQDG